MALRNITGTIEYANGSIPANSRAEFYLSGIHIDAVTITHSAVYAVLDGSGDISVNLYPNDVGYGANRYNVDLVTYSDSQYIKEIARVNLGKIYVEDVNGQILQDLLALFSGPSEPLTVAQEASQDAIDAAAAAAASAATALGATGIFASTAAFFADATVHSIGATLFAKTGEAWLIVTPGTGDFNHPVSGVGVEVKQGGVTAYGPTQTADDYLAVKRASTDGLAHFPRIDNLDTEYLTSAYTAGDFDGSIWSVDPGVEVDTGFGLEQTITGDIEFATDVPMPATLQKTRYIALKTLPDYSKNCLPMPQVASFRKQREIDLSSEVVGRAVEWPGSDTFTSAAGSGTGVRYTVTATGGEGWRGAFAEIGPWETISGVIENAQPGNIGVIIRGKDGYAVVYGNAAASVYTSSRKPNGGAVSETNVSWTRLGQGSFTHYAPKKSVWGVTRIDAQRAIVTINGQQLVEAENVGDIFEVGFVAYNNTGDIIVAGLTLERRTDMQFAIPRVEALGIFGDSMAENQAGSWGRLLKQRLNGFAGFRVNEVVNYAVGGTDLAAILTSIQTNIGFVDSPFVPLTGGTNDIQSLTAIATFETRAQAILDEITGAGKVPIWVLPWMYYGQAQAELATGIAGVGQNAVNYDAGAPYRAILKRLVAAAGGVFYDPCYELPYADPSDLVLNPDNPLLRDNIHADAMAYQLFAIGITQAIADRYWSMPESIEGSFPASAFLNSTTGTGLRYAMDKAGMVTLFGSFENSATTDQNILQLPRWIRPNVAFNVGYNAVGATDTFAARGIISNTGVISQADVPTGTTALIVNATFRAAI